MTSTTSSQTAGVPSDDGRPTLGDEVRRVLDAAERTRVGIRRENGEDRPLGERAGRTRSKLLAVAYQRFIDHGYRATSVQDIHEAAGVSLGTFYQYFRDKAEVIATLVAEMIASSGRTLFPPLDLAGGGGGSHNVVETFVRNYAATADFQHVWEEVTHIEDVASQFRWDVSNVIDRSLQASIELGQAAGTVPADLDPEGTARALGAMVDRYCYRTFVVDDRRDEATVDHTVAVLSDLWERILDVD